MNRRHFIALAGSFAGIGHIACKKQSLSNVLRVSSHPYFSMSSLYLAEELGYFEEMGLQIKTERITSSAQAIPLAAGGKLDVLFTGSSAALVNAIAKGSHLRIVAGREIASPTCSDFSTVFGRREVFPDGLRDIRLLKGKRIALDLMIGWNHFGMDMMLASAGMTAEELDIINMSRSELILAIMAGKVDAIIITDSAARFSNMTDRIVRGISLANALPYHQVSYIVFGPRLLDGNPDTGVRFLSAYLRGAREFLAGKTPKFLNELALSNRMDPDAARKACRNSFVHDGRIDLPSLDRFIQWAREHGYCPIPVRAAQLTDMRFLEKLALYKGASHP
jgi:NitT/TauT family transport system substrate-binding protein